MIISTQNGELVVFGKKRLFTRMQEYTNVVQMAIFRALIFEEPSLNTDRGKRIAACAANLMVGRDSPDGDSSEQHEARELAARILRRNTDIRFASAQCLRTTATIQGTQTPFFDNMKAIEWIAQFGDLPMEAPNPDSMHELACRLGTRYGVLESQ